MEIIIRDEQGNIINEQTKKSYEIGEGLTSLTEIEGAVTELKRKMLPAIDELITYLTKHSDEIIDYDRRQWAGKPIGSGRMEKAVDLMVGHRQKRKGMRWSDLGSRALLLLKMVELNGQWPSLWASS